MRWQINWVDSLVLRGLRHLGLCVPNCRANWRKYRSLTLWHDVDLRLRGQTWLVAVPGDERLHEVSIEILERFPRSMTDPSIPFLQIRTDKGKPHVACQSHIRP